MPKALWVCARLPSPRRPALVRRLRGTCAYRGVEAACVFLRPEALTRRARSARTGVRDGQRPPRAPLPGSESAGMCVPLRLL